MVNIYLSRPLDVKLKNEVHLIERSLLKFLLDKKLIYDQNHMYKIVYGYDWSDDERSDFKDRFKLLSKRVLVMGKSDYFVFFDHWMDFPECKIDVAYLKAYNMTKRIILQMHEGEIQLCKI